MMKFVYLLLLLLLPVAVWSHGDGHWERYVLNHPTFVPSSIVFADTNVGYMFGCDTSKVRSEIGGVLSNTFYLYRTLDGGRNWNMVNLDQFNFSRVGSGLSYGSGQKDDSWLYRVPNSSCVYFAYIVDSIKSRKGYMRSLDSGRTWSLVIGTPASSSDPRNLLALFDESRGLAYADGLLMRTVNGCQNFYFVTLDTTLRHYINPNSSATYDFDWSDRSNYVFIVSDTSQKDSGSQGSYSLHSSDGGVHWSVGQYPSATTAPLIHSVKNTPCLFALTRFARGEGSIRGSAKPWGVQDKFTTTYVSYGLPRDSISYLRSLDYGQTWEAQYSYGKRRFGFEAVSANDIWMTVSRGRDRLPPIHPDLGFEEDAMVQEPPPPPASVIVHTTDGGLTWSEDNNTLQIRESEVDGQLITSVDSSHLWIAGVFDNTTYIYRYVASATSASVEYGHGASGFRSEYLMDLYPLPADESLTVSLKQNLPIRSVTMFDMVGRKIGAAISKSNDSQCSIDTHYLPDGLYFILASTDAEQFSKPILVRHQ